MAAVKARCGIENLQEEILLQDQEETERRNYEWIESLSDITFWEFEDSSSVDACWFYTLLDLPTNDASSWQHLASLLELSSEDIKWVDCHNRNGPSQAAMQKLQQKDSRNEVALSKVLNALLELERHDLLSCIQWRTCAEKCRELRQWKSSQISEKGILVKESFPRGSTYRQKRCENLKRKGIVKTALLIHAEDRREDAEKIAKYLRTPTHSRGCIGVLLIAEQKRKLLVDCHNTLHKWFLQMDYIVPLLSREYLAQIQNKVCSTLEEVRWNRFLYRLMQDEFVNNGSLNFRCRPVCPSDIFVEMRANVLIQKNGLFQCIWSTEKEKLEELALIMIKS